MKDTINIIGVTAAGATVGFLGFGASEAIRHGMYDSCDYLLFAFIAAIVSSVAYNVGGKNK